MTTTLLERKLDRAFGHMDVNRTGHIDHGDLSRLADRLSQGFHEPPGSPKAAAVADGLEGFWRSLTAAIDHDGEQSITPIEWQAGVIGAFVEPAGGFESGLRPAAEAVAGIADTDGDGVVSYPDFATLLHAFGAHAGDARVAFEHLDPEGRGAITVDDLVGAVRQYYTGTRPAAGDWLFGEV